MLPLALPRQTSKESDNILVLAADIGGTKTNLGLFKSYNSKMILQQQKKYASKAYDSFHEIIKNFLQELQCGVPKRLCVGVAGPVIHGRVETTNLPWKLNANILKSETGIDEVSLINDLEATAYGLAGVGDADVVTLHKGNDHVLGNIAIVAPGTGLGEAGMFWDGANYHPFATEGGHAFFGPEDELDAELLLYLRKTHGQVSWEHVACGPAIHALYLFLRDVKNMQEAPAIAAQLSIEDPSKVISEHAVSESCELCIKTMQLFVKYLARESCNLVLKLKATGGLFLGGGIPPKIIPLLRQQLFYKSFTTCDRMEELVTTVPIKLINNSNTALLGAAYFGAFGHEQVF